jgi:biotin carboxylase
MATQKSVNETAAAGGAGAEWGRPPKTGIALEGLYRSQIFKLITSGQVRSAAIKAPGAARTGMRLVHLPSLRNWIASQAVNGEG